jgi:hypothetical protein
MKEEKEWRRTVCGVRTGGLVPVAARSGIDSSTRAGHADEVTVCPDQDLVNDIKSVDSRGAPSVEPLGERPT